MIKTQLEGCRLAGDFDPRIPAQAAEQAGMIKVKQGAVIIETRRSAHGCQSVRRLWWPTACGLGTMVRLASFARNTPAVGHGRTPRSWSTSLTQYRAGWKMALTYPQGHAVGCLGKIAKRTPESVDFHTPTSVLGVRGTRVRH